MNATPDGDDGYVDGYIVSGGPLRPRPDDPATLAHALELAADRAPTAGIGVVDSDTGPATFLAYPELLDRASRVLGGLRASGVKAGDDAILQVPAIDGYLVALWACLLGGVRPVTLTSPASYHEPGPVLDKLRHVWQVLHQPVVIGDGPIITAAADGGHEHGLAGMRVLPLAECAEAEPVTEPPPAAPEDVALYMLSSGTTGRPKVIPLTHQSLLELGIGARDQLGAGRDDVWFNWLPLDHSAPLLLYHLVPVFTGTTNLHARTDWMLADPLRWLTVLARHRVHHSWSPMFGYRLVTNALAASAGTGGPDLDLSAVRSLVCGGEQVTVAAADEFLAATAGFGITPEMFVPAWGMTETTTALTFCRYTDPRTVRQLGGRTFVGAGTVGPAAELRVVDDAGVVLPAGRTGRLQVRSARITPGYLGDEQANREAFTGDGWFDTGDLACLADECLTITGRRKDVVILNGQNYSCLEIEEAVSAVPGVRAGLVAAVGVPDQARGSETLAVVFVAGAAAGEPGGSGSIQGIQAALAERLGLTASKVVAVADRDFPRTESGKVQRAVLRDRLTSGELIPAEPLAQCDIAPTPTTADHAGLRTAVLAAFRDVLGMDIEPDRPLYEQGVDSIRVPRLAAAVGQAVGRHVSATMLLRHPTVDALTAALATPAAARRAEPAGGPRTPVADRRVAIIGMAGRFPGADSVEEFWDNLRRGVQSIRFFGPEQLAAAGVPADEYQHPDYVPASGVLGDGTHQAVAGFDAELFGVSAREAELLDPQQRLFLECCHQALEQAGYAGGDPGQRIGVFAGSGMNLYAQRSYLLRNLAGLAADPVVAMQVAMGNQPDFLATRVGYRLGLTGPAMSVQTACSTSLVAVHLAVQALLTGDADLALAGAAAIHVPQTIGYTAVDGTMLSPTGRCRAFDADADGTVGGNGVAAVVLKRLDRALADGDTVHAVIIGSAVNNDGADKVGFTAPSVSGQIGAATAALDAAGVGAQTIGYVEAHGTGTRLGDPMEVQALAEAFAARTGAEPAGPAGPVEPHCAIGSVKANVGHLDSCAGMAGLIKAALVLRHGVIPPQINFDQPNPAIDLDRGPFFVTTKERHWPRGEQPRRAAVQALGVGGTNANVILEEPPLPAQTSPEAATAAGADTALVLSAASRAALTELAAGFADRLRDREPPALADLFTSTALGRRHRRHRLVALGGSAAELADALDAYRDGEAVPWLVQGEVDAGGPGPTAFAFSGQGSLPAGFARELYGWSELVRTTVDRCAEHYRNRWDGDLLAPLLDPGPSGFPSMTHRLRPGEPVPTALAQPALFAFQVALAELWASIGVRPEYVVGHSVGEYAAWCVAGGMSVEDGLDLVTARGRLMQARTPDGAMIAVRADRRTVDAVRAVVPDLDVAVVNGATDHVLAGDPAVVAEATRLLERRDVLVRALPVRRAFHSVLLDPMLDELDSAVAAVRWRPTGVALASTVDGALRPAGTVPDAGYFRAQTRYTARYDLALATLAGAGCRRFVEVGPGAVLTGIGRRNRHGGDWLPSQGTSGPAGSGFLRAVAGLYRAGVAVDWRPLAAGGRRVPLPTHPFHRRTYWIGPPNST